MNSKKSKLLLTSLITIFLLGIILFTYTNDNNSDDSKNSEESNIYHNVSEVSYQVLEPFFTLTNAQDIYNESTQSEIYDKIEALKKEKDYTIDDALVIYNPFQTNTQSLYLYFTSQEPASLTYTIHVDNEDIPDITRTCYNTEESELSEDNSSGNNFSSTHEYQLIGLIPDSTNQITLTLTYASGSTDTRTFTYKTGSLLGEEDLVLSSESGESTSALTDGFYVVSSAQNFIYLYDNDGILRSEIPLIEYRYLRLVFKGDKMYFSIGLNKLAEMNSLGMVTKIYDLGNYQLHHDYVFDDDGNLLVLGTDTTTSRVEDRVLKMNLESGEVTEVLDLASLFPDYYTNCTADEEGELDWMHINTIQWMGNDSIILSSRETSTIMRIDNLYTTPSIKYMLGADSFWEDSAYSDYLYTKASDFKNQLGQHTVTYVKDDSLEEGQYYLYMFDNNMGISTTRPDYDWSANFDGIGTSYAASGNEVSYYYKYLVDENSKTYDLIESFEVPYSGYMSSVQEFGENIIVDSSSSHLLNEYDKDNKLIRSFDLTSAGEVYRTFKYSFEDFYFYE